MLAAPATVTGPSLRFENSFTTLPSAFFTALAPTALPNPYMIAVSAPAAALIGLSVAQVEHAELVEAFAGNTILPGSQPLAAIYSGHQFGVWAGQLGDGRALLLGDLPATGGAAPDRL